MDLEQYRNNQRKANLRTGLILASIALAFFVGIFVKIRFFNR